MRSLDLSFKIILIQWGNTCVDWFMNLFADPEYYWTEETYPVNKSNTLNYTPTSQSEKNNPKISLTRLKVWDSFKWMINMKETHIIKTISYQFKSIINLVERIPYNINANKLNMMLKQQFLV